MYERTYHSNARSNPSDPTHNKDQWEIVKREINWKWEKQKCFERKKVWIIFIYLSKNIKNKREKLLKIEEKENENHIQIQGT